MKYLKNSIKANLYKMIHSRLIWIHLGAPLFAVLVFCAYYTISPWDEVEKVKIYLQAVTMAFPLMIAIVTTMIYEVDHNAGKFQMILTIPTSKTWAHAGNILALLVLGLFSSLLAVGGFGIVFYGMGYHEFGFLFYGKQVFLVFGTNVVVYLLQYFICYTFEKGVSLGLGIIGTLLSPLLYLGLGDKIWMYVPCSYGIRMTAYSVVCSRKADEMYQILQTEYRNGACTIVVVTLAGIILFMLWGKRWEGSSLNAE